ncbi:WbqC family protein [Tessaracoccus sp. OH4464_COT-324]|uniref:WbqC family protein n=1 Tax=Tessaracoccus sp. OH4464_COT-324 TaxID=2491059 RepID=UPI000F63C025|nr:WbqC family protein [Tessaracoccus sp. OH4464_COT-324]RRD46157.1 hypothetical protein EII42_08190 [Tessaracoccus sp. OH4464_COT-324]
MIVTIHQPNFAPWTGYFDKMARSDVFVLLDTVPFTKGGYQNRVRIKGPNGPQWLTVPVITKGRLGQPTNEVETNEARPWRGDHVKTLRTLYGKAGNVSEAIELLEAVYASPSTNLAELCIALITRFHARYGLGTRLVRASELSARGSSSQLLADIVAELGGDVYLSGPSGRNYLDRSVFDRLGIAVEYHSFTPTPYPQVGADFVGGLSMLDHLANGAPVWW